MSVTLLACTATANKANSTANTGQQSTPDQITAQAPAAPPVAHHGSNQIASPDSLSRLQAQITALQEQVIKLSSDTNAILKNSQLLVANTQMQNAASQSDLQTGTEQKPVGKKPPADQSLKTILQRLEEYSPSPNGAFGIVSSYTASKQWVLIRFDRQTGETWLADNSGWNSLSEAAELPISQYDVHLIRADQDKKGYVASRIDQRSGETWWLNKKQWVVYQ
ncbi:MAG: hypothetical protein HRU04_03885 [Oceanospirillaceae bacterium]|nr:hypothetical protein [Oceanospirillaceae bacterium]